MKVFPRYTLSSSQWKSFSRKLFSEGSATIVMKGCTHRKRPQPRPIYVENLGHLRVAHCSLMIRQYSQRYKQLPVKEAVFCVVQPVHDSTFTLCITHVFQSSYNEWFGVYFPKGLILCSTEEFENCAQGYLGLLWSYWNWDNRMVGTTKFQCLQLW